MTRRLCSGCRIRYDVESLDIPSTCPFCGHRQDPRSNRMKYVKGEKARHCTQCSRDYPVESLDIISTCPHCGYVQSPRLRAPVKDERYSKKAMPPIISRADIDPRFLTTDEFQYMGRSPDGTLRLMVPSRIIEVTPDRLRRLADRLEEMVKSEEMMARP